MENVSILEEDEELDHGPISRLFIGVISLTVFVVTTLLWSVIGFFFWIPLLARSVAVFSGMILFCALTNASTKAVYRQLTTACSFYIDGFALIRGAVQRTRRSDRHAEASPLQLASVTHFLCECVWTLVFWTTLLLMLPKWMTSPIAPWLDFVRDAWKLIHSGARM